MEFGGKEAALLTLGVFAGIVLAAPRRKPGKRKRSKYWRKKLIPKSVKNS